jgi:hypothetical protein
VAVCPHAAEADAQPLLVCCLCGGLLWPLYSRHHTPTGQCILYVYGFVVQMHAWTARACFEGDWCCVLALCGAADAQGCAVLG